VASGVGNGLVSDAAPTLSAAALVERFERVRAFTEKLCAPLETEDYVVQSMPDASPVKWHLGHTTWFFEKFLLERAPGYRPYDERFGFLHNSYYESVGPRHTRARRGLLTRPTVRDVYAYRAAITQRVAEACASERRASVLETLELGIEHERQHQELILTDLQHALSENPLKPTLTPFPKDREREPSREGDTSHAGGLVTIGHASRAFAFDNESPAHRVHLEPFALHRALVTCGQFAEFMADGGYERPELWLSDGFAAVKAEGWRAPLYWEKSEGAWHRFSLHGMIAVDPDAPVCHVSFYEAQAFAEWAHARLPTEAEWETAATDAKLDGQFVDDGALVPLPRAHASPYGGVWTWTASAYSPYPGFAPKAGALGEYNGKFMINQMVLRGGSCFTSRDHIRATYRNFFPPSARWQVSGIRLARTL
jgi:ergothioneine biosynthesis protein EgtB